MCGWFRSSRKIFAVTLNDNELFTCCKNKYFYIITLYMTGKVFFTAMLKCCKKIFFFWQNFTMVAEVFWSVLCFSFFSFSFPQFDFSPHPFYMYLKKKKRNKRKKKKEKKWKNQYLKHLLKSSTFWFSVKIKSINLFGIPVLPINNGIILPAQIM